MGWVFTPARIVDEVGKAFKANSSFADVSVPIPPLPKIILGIIYVEALDFIQADDGVEFLHSSPIAIWCSYVITGSVYVTRVKTDAKTI